MREPWFFAPPERWSDKDITLAPDESRHALNVLRVAPPDVITVIDGRGAVARCAAARVEDGNLIAEVLEREQKRALKPQVIVYQGAAKGSKLDDAIERLAELGVGECRVFSSERAVVRWDEAKIARLDERWNALARSAAKQSRNPYTMVVGGLLSWDELVARISEEPLAIALWEGATLPMRTAFVPEAERIALVVGPEGGFPRSEAEALADAGAQVVSLGPHILRTENAAFVAATGILWHYGLIG